MKSLRSLTIAIIILIFPFFAQAQSWKTVTGNGHVVSKDRQTDSFTRLKVSSGIDVYLRQGNEVSVKIEADENLHDCIMTEVKNGELNVYSDCNIRSAEKKRVYVTMKDINSIKTTSAGDVFGESPLKADKLELSASSAGDINIEVKSDNIDIDISSSGDISIKGETDILKADLSSAGDLKAFDLLAKEADISVSSAGDAEVNVSDKLNARASSAGDINYMGNPKYIDSHSSSAGGIHKR